MTALSIPCRHTDCMAPAGNGCVGKESGAYHPERVADFDLTENMLNETAPGEPPSKESFDAAVSSELFGE